MPARRSAAAQIVESDSQDQLSPEEARLLGAEGEEPSEEPGGEEPPEPREGQRPDSGEARFQQLLEQNRQLTDRLSKFDRFIDDFRAGDQRAREAIEQVEHRRKRPDPASDPFGAMAWDMNERFTQLEKQLQPLQEQIGQTAEQSRASREAMEFQAWAQGDVNTVRSRHEDYDGITTQLFQALHGLATSCGYDAAQAGQLLNTFVTALSSACRQKGVSAAENFYAMGKQLFAGGGAQTTPAFTRQRSPLAQATSELERLRSGQRLRGASGGTSLQPQNRLGYLPPEQFDQLSDDEFARLAASPRAREVLDRNFRRLEGVLNEPEYAM
jgi:hypothetical protein